MVWCSQVCYTCWKRPAAFLKDPFSSVCEKQHRTGQWHPGSCDLALLWSDGHFPEVSELKVVVETLEIVGHPSHLIARFFLITLDQGMNRKYAIRSLEQWAAEAWNWSLELRAIVFSSVFIIFLIIGPFSTGSHSLVYSTMLSFCSDMLWYIQSSNRWKYGDDLQLPCKVQTRRRRPS